VLQDKYKSIISPVETGLEKTIMKKITNTIFAALLTFACVFGLGCGDDSSGSSGPKPTKILCIGDSITRGQGATVPYPLVLSQIEGVPAINAGRDGDLSAEGLGRISGELTRNTPSHVCIMYGANDAILGIPTAATESNIEGMVVAAKNFGAKVVLGTVNNFTGGDGEAFNGRVGRINNAIRAVAKRQKVKIADVNGKLSDADISADEVHPNQNGANAIADVFASKL